MSDTIPKRYTIPLQLDHSEVLASWPSRLFCLPNMTSRRLSVSAVVRERKMKLTLLAVVHLGRALCGHDGIIHGGLLATVFDETLARNVSLSQQSSAIFR